MQMDGINRKDISEEKSKCPLIDRYNFALNWLLNSGIQNLNNDLNIGGYYSWYKSETKEFQHLYPEITGYALTWLHNLISQYCFENIEYKIKAENAFTWLEKQATFSKRGVKSRYNYNSNELTESKSYVFDTGMVLFGVTNIYKLFKNDKYLIYAKNIADYILNMQKEDGSFYAFYNNKTGKKIDSSKTWSSQSGGYHAKLSLGLLNLFEITSDPSYKASAINCCEYALTTQEENGRFITHRKEKHTYLHPHCYTLEGLFYAGVELGNKNYLNSALNGLKWSISGQMQSGGIPFIYYTNDGWGKYEHSDVLAQILRLGVLFLDESYENKVKQLLNRLVQFQDLSSDLHSKGGFHYGFDEMGHEIFHINSWCTMFSIQAMKLCLNRKSTTQSMI